MPLKSKTSLRKNRPSEDEYDPVFMDVADVSRARSFLFYGRSGSGKTTLLGSFPKPLLVVDVKDEGTDSIVEVEDCQVTEVREWEDLDKLYFWLLKNPKKFKTVGIDTVTQLQELCIVKVLKDKKKDTSNAGNWGSMTKQEWGQVAQLMKRVLIDWRDLPMEVVFLAQDRTFNVNEDDDSSDILMPEVGARLSPSVAAALNAAVSVIGNTYIRLRQIKKRVEGKTIVKEKTEYCLRVGPSPIYTTKLRKPKGNVAPEFLVDPVYEDIIEVIKGE